MKKSVLIVFLVLSSFAAFGSMILIFVLNGQYQKTMATAQEIIDAKEELAEERRFVLVLLQRKSISVSLQVLMQDAHVHSDAVTDLWTFTIEQTDQLQRNIKLTKIDINDSTVCDNNCINSFLSVDYSSLSPDQRKENILELNSVFHEIEELFIFDDQNIESVDGSAWQKS